MKTCTGTPTDKISTREEIILDFFHATKKLFNSEVIGSDDRAHINSFFSSTFLQCHACGRIFNSLIPSELTEYYEGGHEGHDPI